jgi:AcrR family transcriptional regulator
MVNAMPDLTVALRDRHRERVITTIAELALDLFATHGYETTSVDEIAAAAGCSPRTFYRYFSAKDDVVFHGVPELLNQLRARLEEHLRAGMRAWDAVTEALADVISRFDEMNQDLVVHRMQLWLEEPALHGRYLGYVSTAETVITECLIAHYGLLDQHDDTIHLIAVTATGAYRVAAARHFTERAPDGLARHLRELLASVAAGLAPRANSLGGLT